MLARLLELHVAVIGNDDPKFLLHQIVLKRYQLDFETCSKEFEQIARQLDFKLQLQIFRLLPMHYD